MRIYRGEWFKTREEAEARQKELGYGVIYSNAKYSKTKRDHTIAAMMFGFDPNEYPYSLNWNQFM